MKSCHDSESAVWLVQRCVIIQKDENGFGLTVSGDNPVFVQLVKEDGAAERAGVQTGDRIIKESHVMIVRIRPIITHTFSFSFFLPYLRIHLISSAGSYVALTVLGRPPGLPQIPLLEGEAKVVFLGAHTGSSSVTSPNSPGQPMGERPYSPHDRSPSLFQSIFFHLVSNGHDPCSADVEPPSFNTPLMVDLVGHFSERSSQRSMSERSKCCVFLLSSPLLQDSLSPSTVSSPSSRYVSQIIGAEDDYFDSDQEQVNGQCSCFQSMELLKSRPAHLAAFLHHVVSQFDPAPLLCYLYADLCKQTNSKETRRVFMDFHNFFIDRGAVSSVERTELIPEELNRQYVQMVQDTQLPDIQRNLEDFRQKRSMGLTLAEGELARLDTERVRDRVALERERACAENIITKIEDVLLTTQSTEEEKCTTMQYVILTYMKHLGVKVKEPRGLESKWVRINFLPKIKKSIKTEKEGGEEKVKRTRFPSILGPPRRPSRVDPTSAVGKAMDLNKPRPQKQLSQPCLEHLEAGRLRASQSSEGSELIHSSPTNATSPTNSTTNNNSCICCSLSPRLDGLGSTEVQSEDDQGGTDSEHDPLNWQQLVGREVLAGLQPHEIKRQEVINELFYTERAHLRMLKVLDNIFYQKLTREGILPPADIKNIFTNLEDIVQLHVWISEQMVTIRKRNETSVIDQIGDDLLSWFSRGEEEKIKQAVGTFCSNQPFALELIKSRQKKDSRFTSFMQEAESNRLCRRLQLKDIIPVEMQRLTKYPLLLENIAKYTDDTVEKDKVKKAGDCCRKILNHVNQAVKESENKQRLEDYQRRLDLSSLKQTENPMISELKNLDLTKKKMVHEGPLSWKVNKDKTIELYTLLLEDILVLLQKQDERLILKCHSKNLSGTADTKHIFSPIIKLNAVLVRSVATDNKSFFVLSMSDNGAQIYELMAQTVSEQRMWQRQITQRADAMKVKPNSVIPLPQTEYVPPLSIKLLCLLLRHMKVHISAQKCILIFFLKFTFKWLYCEVVTRDIRLVFCNKSHFCSSSAPTHLIQFLINWTLLRLPAGYLVLEGYGGSGESSTDDDLQATGKQLSASRGCGAGDSGISLRFSSASQAGSISSFSRQVLSHIRNLQTNLNHLKVHGWMVDQNREGHCVRESHLSIECS
uniref:Rho guanine nucleotide exchange factor (GEF) 12a n=1 Tax=Oncorhynchus tshawytscha TaxID=74940 RepID=A0A8C8GL63_ONCTS